MVVTEYVGNQLQYKGKEVVTREKHTKCKCDCIVKEKVSVSEFIFTVRGRRQRGLLLKLVSYLSRMSR